MHPITGFIPIKFGPKSWRYQNIFSRSAYEVRLAEHFSSYHEICIGKGVLGKVFSSYGSLRWFRNVHTIRRETVTTNSINAFWFCKVQRWLLIGLTVQPKVQWPLTSDTLIWRQITITILNHWRHIRIYLDRKLTPIWRRIVKPLKTSQRCKWSTDVQGIP